MKLVRLLVAGLVIQASMTSAFAQFGGRGPGGGGRAMSAGLLLQQKSVQEELKLTSDQMAKLKEAGEKMRASFSGGAGGGGDREEARKKFEEAQKAADKAMAEILTADQNKRVKEIALQQAGPMALANADTAKDVGLTEDQQSKVKAIADGLREEMGKLFQAGAGQDARAKMQDLRKSANDKVVALLTDDQKKKWADMTGKKFEGEITFGRPGAGAPPAGGAPGQGGNRRRPEAAKDEEKK